MWRGDCGLNIALQAASQMDSADWGSSGLPSYKTNRGLMVVSLSPPFEIARVQGTIIDQEAEKRIG